MKILMLIHRFPYPPVRGDCIRSWGEVEFLSRQHDVWLACVDRVAPWPVHVARARRCCRDVAVVVRAERASLVHGAASLLLGHSVSEGYFYDKRLAAVLRRWDRTVGFDAILTFSPAMAPYAALVRAKRRVLDMNDVESDRWLSYAERSVPPLSWLYALEAWRLEKAETGWVRGHDISLLVNDCERSKLPAELRERTAVVRTGVDLTRYDVRRDGAGQVTVPREPVVGFLGSMAYPPNVRAVNWFGQSVWPQIKRSVPEARWLIVGRRPTRAVRGWARQPGVTVTGYVEDVRPLLRAMRVFVCPVREQIGVQTKLIEALAAARAAVVTPAVAAGIDCDDPPPFMVAASPGEFAEAVVRLLRDEAQARALALRARTVAEANYSAEDQVRRIEHWLEGNRPDDMRALPREAVALAQPCDLAVAAGHEVVGL